MYKIRLIKGLLIKKDMNQNSSFMCTKFAQNNVKNIKRGVVTCQNGMLTDFINSNK